MLSNVVFNWVGDHLFDIFSRIHNAISKKNANVEIKRLIHFSLKSFERRFGCEPEL